MSSIAKRRQVACDEALDQWHKMIDQMSSGGQPDLKWLGALFERLNGELQTEEAKEQGLYHAANFGFHVSKQMEELSQKMKKGSVDNLWEISSYWRDTPLSEGLERIKQWHIDRCQSKRLLDQIAQSIPYWNSPKAEEKFKELKKAFLKFEAEEKELDSLEKEFRKKKKQQEEERWCAIV